MPTNCPTAFLLLFRGCWARTFGRFSQQIQYQNQKYFSRHDRQGHWRQFAGTLVQSDTGVHIIAIARGGIVFNARDVYVQSADQS